MLIVNYVKLSLFSYLEVFYFEKPSFAVENGALFTINPIVDGTTRSTLWIISFRLLQAGSIHGCDQRVFCIPTEEIALLAMDAMG